MCQAPVGRKQIFWPALTGVWDGRVRHVVYSCVPMADAKTARLRAAVAAAGGAWHEVGPALDLAGCGDTFTHTRC